MICRSKESTRNKLKYALGVYFLHLDAKKYRLIYEFRRTFTPLNEIA